MNDYIKREDAIKVASEECQEFRGIFGRIDDALNALPSADVVDRKRGEWKWTHGGVCSECGYHNTNFDYNFCPNCGADMRGERCQ